MVIDWDDIAGNIGKFKDLTSLGVTNFSRAIALSVFWLYIASLVGFLSHIFKKVENYYMTSFSYG